MIHVTWPRPFQGQFAICGLALATVNHRPRGSASPVFTATDFVNWKGQFWTPYRIDTPQRRRPLRLCQIGCISVEGSLLGTWVKYNQNYFYLCPFFGNSPTSPTGQTRRRIFTHDGSNDADARKDVPFLGIFHTPCTPFGGSKYPKNTFGAWIGVFKPNSWNKKNAHTIKTTASIPIKFAKW